MSIIGVRVVRGPNWSWGKEDGGEGYAGILRNVNLENKTAIVQWDNGNQIQCRIGCLDKYDLRIIDNAQVGVNHQRIICDACDLTNISGMRYKCMNCYDYDLCSMCYHGDKHNLNHSFRRIESPDSRGIVLPPRSTSRKCELKGIFKGAEVVRGVDWEWGNQDGGEGKLGIVLNIQGWKRKTSRSTAYVQWLHGNTELYRLGHKGHSDIQFVEASSGGFYYPEHLPILGQTEDQMEWNQILDTIEIQQVTQLESEEAQMTAVKEDCENERWEREKCSTLAELGSIESMYASKVIDYNNAINRGLAKPNLVNEFADMVGGFRNDEVKEIWHVIKCMTQLPAIPSSKDVVKTRYTKEFIDALIQNGRKYLEDSWKTHISSTVNKNASQIDTSETYPLVHAFVGVRFKGEYTGFQDGMIDNRPLWPMVYYCIRAGDLSAAVSCLECSPLAFQDIMSVLRAKLNPSNDFLIGVLEENVRSSYRTTVRNETDPFKRIVWSLLGGYGELSEVIKTADDYLWFKLSAIRTDDYNQYANLQYMILEEHGEGHYDAFNKPLQYFKLLLLTGQFEAAVDFLYRTDDFKTEGAHMAVALYDMNFLALTQDGTLPLISSNSEDPLSARRLNLALLIKNYVGRFENRSLNGALHYFFLLKNCTDIKGKNLFEVLVSDLAGLTREYEKIFGKLQADGTKTGGLIDQFKNVEVKIETSAQALVKSGLYEEAIDLYGSVNNMEGALTIMCLLLSKVVHLENQPDSLRNRLQEKATILEERLSQNGADNLPTNLVASFTKLKGLLKFFDLYRARQYPDALEEIIALEILPLRQEELDVKVREIRNYNKDFFAVIPNILLATMTILLAQHDVIKKKQKPFSRSRCLHRLREQANCIVNFSERLPPKLTGYVNNQLTKMYVLIGGTNPESFEERIYMFNHK